MATLPSEMRLRLAASALSAKSKSLVFGIGVGLLLVGTAFTVLLAWIAYREYKVRSWPQVEAMVVRAWVETRTERRVSNLPRSRRQDSIDRDEPEVRYVTMYDAHTEFQFELNHVPRVARDGTTFSQYQAAELETYKNSYKPGSRHLIRYDPSDPEKVRAETSSTASFMMLGVAMSVTMSMAVLGFWLVSRGR